MNTIFKKLNYKEQQVIHIVFSPESFETNLEEIGVSATIKRTLISSDKANFILAFFTKQSEVNKYSKIFDKALQSDGLLWIAYPKGTSKKFKCDFNRDTGWQALGNLGFEPVRMIAIDEDWSALRFKRVEQIKIMTRSAAISQKGNERITRK